jgi:hypothetical protein
MLSNKSNKQIPEGMKLIKVPKMAGPGGSIAGTVDKLVLIEEPEDTCFEFPENKDEKVVAPTVKVNEPVVISLKSLRIKNNLPGFFKY